MDWLRRQKFLALLVILILMIVVYPVLEDYVPTRFLFIAMRTVLFVVAFFIILKDKHYRTGALIVGVPAAIGFWAEYLRLQPPHIAFAASLHVLAAFFLVFLITVILRAVYRDEDVTADSIFGTLCGYLLVALTFGHFYVTLEVLSPGSFAFANEQTRRAFEAQTNDYYLLSYFSLITITTVGFGDITPITPATRGFAAVEAIIGQFYIAVLVAELIGKRVSNAVSNRHTE